MSCTMGPLKVRPRCTRLDRPELNGRFPCPSTTEDLSMATAQKIRELITPTTTGSVRPRVPREVREEDAATRAAAAGRERPGR